MPMPTASNPTRIRRAVPRPGANAVVSLSATPVSSRVTIGTSIHGPS